MIELVNTRKQKRFTREYLPFCELDKQTEMALSLRGLARLSLDLENYIQSKKLFRSSLKISEDNNDTWEMIRCLDSLGFIALYFGEYAEAREYLEKVWLYQKQMGINGALPGA